MGTISPAPGQRPAAASPAAPAAAFETPARGGCLTLWLGLSILGSAVVLVAWLALPAQITRVMPRAGRGLLDATVFMTTLQGFFALALWRWKKWGFYGIVATNVLVMLATISAGGQPSTAGGLVGLGILWWLLQDHWDKMPYPVAPSRSGRIVSWVLGGAILLLIGARFLRSTGESTGGFDPERDPAADIRMALDQGSAEHRRVLVLVGGNWSPASLDLEKKLRSGETGRLLEKEFVLVRVAVSPAIEPVERLKACPRPDAVPHLYVLSRNGDCNVSVPSARLPADDAKLLELLRGWRL